TKVDADTWSLSGMNIVKATAKYEAWLSHHLRLLPADLTFKHEQMRSAPFPFLRATYYRWAQVWEEICPEAAQRRWCWGSAACILKTSERGAISRAASSGASTISTKPGACLIRTI